MMMQLGYKEKVLKKFCENRINLDRNVIMLITGDTGTGKTLSAFRLGVELDMTPDGFSNKYITQNADNVLNIFREIAENKEANIGRVVIYEETQEDMLSMSATTIEAKAMIKLLSKFRYLNGILILTTPRSSHLNRLLMDYVDIHLSTEDIFRERQICRLKVKFSRWVESKGVMFWEFMRVQFQAGHRPPSQVMQFKYIDLQIPPSSIIDFYEGKKTAFFIESMTKERKRIDKKHNKKKKRYPFYCQKCAYEWDAVRPSPLRCPSCNAQSYHLKVREKKLSEGPSIIN